MSSISHSYKKEKLEKPEKESLKISSRLSLLEKRKSWKSRKESPVNFLSSLSPTKKETQKNRKRKPMQKHASISVPDRKGSSGHSVSLKLRKPCKPRKGSPGNSRPSLSPTFLTVFPKLLPFFPCEKAGSCQLWPNPGRIVHSNLNNATFLTTWDVLFSR